VTYLRCKGVASLLRRIGLFVSMTLVAVMALLAVGSAPASATSGSGGGSGWIVIRDHESLPFLPLTNACMPPPQDVVNMSGVLYIVTATSPPDSRGGVTVISTLSAPNLTGYTLIPQPFIEYRGGDGQNTYYYQAMPPYPSTIGVRHWTKLVPQTPDRPTMWLVVTFLETVTTTGTVPVFEKIYLSCSEPTSHQGDD
jgi:hypothetical protein